MKRDAAADSLTGHTPMMRVFSFPTSLLTPPAKTNYDNAFVAATYSWKDFKPEVVAWLKTQYGSAVNEGKKAITIAAGGSRRDADVIVCAQHRRWRKESNGTDAQYDLGICFWTSDGTQIVNFPKQHSEHCITKHKDTTNWFKPLVRVYKNMRNRMVEDGVFEEGIAPSYFIEGMVWNAPDETFGVSYNDSFVNTFNWIFKADKDKLVCASHLHWLVRDATYKSWPTTNFDAYLAATRKYWAEWDQ